MVRFLCNFSSKWTNQFPSFPQNINIYAVTVGKAWVSKRQDNKVWGKVGVMYREYFMESARVRFLFTIREVS